MQSRRIRGLAAALVCAVCACFSHEVKAQGNAFLVFDVTTGQLRMNPGTSGAMTGYTIDSNSASGLSWNSTAVFPSGSYPFPATNTSSRIGAAFYTLGAPNVVPNPSSSITSTNLQLNTANVVASTTPGFVGTPEWVFGNVGPTNLTVSAALAAFGATSQGGAATGNRFYTQQGVTGNQQFLVYTVPEPSTIGVAAGGIVTLGVAGWRRQLSRRRRGVGSAAELAA